MFHFGLATVLFLILNTGCLLGKPGCFHDDTKLSLDEVYYANTGVNQRSKRTDSDIFQQIRVHAYYDKSVDDNITPETSKLVKQYVMPIVINRIKQLLRTRRIQGPIRLARACVGHHKSYIDGEAMCPRGCDTKTLCLFVPVPPEHLQRCREIVEGEVLWSGSEGEGVDNADFILYVSVINTKACKKGAIAQAAHCQLEPDLDRPIAGNINLCRNELESVSHSDEKAILKRNEWKAAITHELMHVMAFSVRLFPFFRDANGQPLVSRSPYTGLPFTAVDKAVFGDTVVKEVIRNDWLVRTGFINRTMHMLVTPAVTAEVRRHFDCLWLEGAELEDQRAFGNGMSHLEKRAFENELMTGIHTPNVVMSRITLAVFEDSGWYKVNYSMAQPLAWGKGLGCSFAMKSCMDWMTNRESAGKSILPYCNNHKRRWCAVDGRSLMYCGLHKYEKELPEQLQNYNHIPGVEVENASLYGGDVSLADYCAYPKESSESFTHTRCSVAANNQFPINNELLEKYGQRSYCFLHGDTWSQFNWLGVEQVPELYGSGCYQVTCDTGGSPWSYVVNIADRSYVCDRAGTVIDIDSKTRYVKRNGTLVCRDYDDVCPENHTQPDKAPTLPSTLPTSNASAAQNKSSVGNETDGPITTQNDTLQETLNVTFESKFPGTTVKNEHNVITRRLPVGSSSLMKISGIMLIISSCTALAFTVVLPSLCRTNVA